MKITFGPRLIFFAVLMISCTTVPKRQPQALSDLLTELQQLRMDLATNAIDGGSCHDYFQNSLKIITEEQIQNYTDAQAEAVSESIMLDTWQIRLSMHRQLDVLAPCRTELRQLFYRLRAIEDLASLRLYTDKQVQVSDFKPDMQSQPVPLKENDFYHGYLGSSGNLETGAVDFHSGDIILSSGGSNFSAILFSLPDYPEQIDHFALVHKDAKGVLRTIESYAQTNGVARFDMDYALKNENPRLLLMRPKDAALGARAADIMMEKVLAGEADPSKKITFDYEMALNDPSKMVCASVTYWGYRWASNDQFIIPEERSTLSPKLKEIFEKTGLSSAPLLTAEDLELDSRFDLLLEFRDHRLMLDARIRESVGQSVFKWMKDDNYQIRNTLRSEALSKIIFPLSKTRLWPLLSKLAGGNKIPNGAPKGFVVTLEQMGNIMNVLYKKASDANQVFKKKTGWDMSHNQMMEALEMYRREDLEKCASSDGPTAELHLLYSPTHCSVKN